MLQRHGLWDGDEIDSGARWVLPHYVHEPPLMSVRTWAAPLRTTRGRNASAVYATRIKR